MGRRLIILVCKSLSALGLLGSFVTRLMHQSKYVLEAMEACLR